MISSRKSPTNSRSLIKQVVPVVKETWKRCRLGKIRKELNMKNFFTKCIKTREFNKSYHIYREEYCKVPKHESKKKIILQDYARQNGYKKAGPKFKKIILEKYPWKFMRKCRSDVRILGRKCTRKKGSEIEFKYDRKGKKKVQIYKIAYDIQKEKKVRKHVYSGNSRVKLIFIGYFRNRAKEERDEILDCIMDEVIYEELPPEYYKTKGKYKNRKRCKRKREKPLMFKNFHVFLYFEGEKDEAWYLCWKNTHEPTRHHPRIKK
ncbi:MAG: hypothetical protein ACFFCS_18510 [Candidatus Hodarchaeota archaeon]